MRNSLQLKLLYSFMLVIVVMMAGMSLGVSALVREQVIAHKQQDLIAKGYDLARVIDTFYKENGRSEKLADFLSNVDSFIDSRVWVVDKSRQIIAISMPQLAIQGKSESGGQNLKNGIMSNSAVPGAMRTVLSELDPVFAGRVWVSTFDNPVYGEKMLVVAVPIKHADGSVEGAVVLHAPVAGINEFMQQIYYYVGITGLVAVIIALFVVMKLTRGIVRPLKAMQEIAGAMAQGDYEKQVIVESGDEVGKLGVALNSLSQDLAKYIAELKKMEKLRREFVANVSHELRTPLTIISGYNEALLNETVDDPAQVKKYHQQMQEEMVRLKRLINDLLDLSRLQSEHAGLEKEKIPLAALVDSVFNMMKQQADQKNVTLVANTQVPIPDILGNGDRIIQLILIFIDNAIKYTPSDGTVTVNISQENDQAVLTMADSGVGIPPDDLPYIWERFYKVDKSHSRKDAGTGLGLAIAKQIIELHQAKADVASELGQGTTFTVKFPFVKE
jgi:signal transduction histidine kinase